MYVMMKKTMTLCKRVCVGVCVRVRYLLQIKVTLHKF